MEVDEDASAVEQPVQLAEALMDMSDSEANLAQEAADAAASLEACGEQAGRSPVKTPRSGVGLQSWGVRTLAANR